MKLTSEERKLIKHEAHELSKEIIDYVSKRTPATNRGALVAALAIQGCFSTLITLVIENRIMDPELFGMIQLELGCDHDHEPVPESEWDA